MEQYQLEVRDVLKNVNSGESGLTESDAQKRLSENGRNALKEEKKKSKIRLFFSQFKDLMTIILVCAAFLSAVLAFVTKDSAELVDTAILLFIILLNAFVGFLQQYRADAAIENLKKLSVCEAKVIRSGKVVKINAEDLVVGDIIELEEGDRIPADCRIIRSDNFRCDESALTGESKPVKKYDCIVKKPALAERTNTAYMSTFCVKGTARCVVTACGMDTEMGKIAGMLHEAKPAPSPLDKIITKLGKIISITVLSVAGVLFLGGLLAHRVSFLQNVMNAVAVAVAAIPEGMGAVVTVILAMGVQRMAKSRAVMRKLGAVETLGSCSVICSDKTGTLTQNKMTVEEIVTAFPAGEAESYRGTRVQRELLSSIRACNTVKGVAGSYVGDPTEVSLLEYADRCEFEYAPKITGGEPFSSERKMMSVLTAEGKLFVKGGADVILKKCTKVLTESGERALTKQDSEEIFKSVSDCSSRAMRVLGFAVGRGAKEEGLTFVGIAAMLDPPKEGAKEAVAACRRAGVRTVMITGDSADTAFAIASRLGIAKHRGEVLTGEELDEMGEEEYARRVAEFSVYARVSPKHKSQIVTALQSRGEVVAMTGDGVNDAPALRAADIGVAMGSGTDVTKNAAEVVISDDDFSTMVHAVEEGRNVFYNVKKTISFFLSTNLAEVFAVLIVSLFLWRYDFLTSTQLLWINLITDSLPVLALGVERTDGVMNRPPVSEKEIFSKSSLVRMLFFGAAQTAIIVGLFLYGVHAWGNEVASTVGFLTLSFLELFHAFNVRNEEGRTKLRDFISNKTLLVTVLIGVVVNVLLVVVPPLRYALSLAELGVWQWLAVFGCSLAIIPIGEIYKAVYLHGKKKGFKGFNRRKKRSLAPESLQ
ncbi:MAG: cation-translocating P-type ATPase [Clostridia bacterium]|nr:cation-translocating P-type ATPase [Clostridia bacterium]